MPASVSPLAPRRRSSSSVSRQLAISPSNTSMACARCSCRRVRASSNTCDTAATIRSCACCPISLRSARIAASVACRASSAAARNSGGAFLPSPKLNCGSRSSTRFSTIATCGTRTRISRSHVVNSGSASRTCCASITTSGTRASRSFQRRPKPRNSGDWPTFFSAVRRVGAWKTRSCSRTSTSGRPSTSRCSLEVALGRWNISGTSRQSTSTDTDAPGAAGQSSPWMTAMRRSNAEVRSSSRRAISACISAITILRSASSLSMAGSAVEPMMDRTPTPRIGGA